MTIMREHKLQNLYKTSNKPVLMRENMTAVLRDDILGASSNEAIQVELRNKKGMGNLIGLYCRPLR